MRPINVIAVVFTAGLLTTSIVMTMDRAKSEMPSPFQEGPLNLDFLDIPKLEIDKDNNVQILPNRIGLFKTVNLESIRRPEDESRVMLAESLDRIGKEGRQGLGISHLKFLWEHKTAIPEHWKKTGQVIYFPEAVRRGGCRYLAGLKWTEGQYPAWDIVMTQIGGEFVDGAKLDERNFFAVLAQ